MVQDLTGVLAATILLFAFGVGSGLTESRAFGLVAFIALAVFTAWILPKVLRGLRAEHDLFLIPSRAIGLALAGVGAEIAEIPLALAAFVAGLAINEGDETAEVRRRLLPFRYVFAVLFFVSIGALIDPRELPAALPWVGILIGLVVAGKVVVVAVVAVSPPGAVRTGGDWFGSDR